MELVVEELHKGNVALHPDDAAIIGTSSGDVVNLTDPSSGRDFHGLVNLLNDIEKGNVGVNDILLAPTGLSAGALLEVTTCSRLRTNLHAVELGIEVRGKKQQELLYQIRLREDKLIKLLKDRAFTFDSSFKWKEIKVDVKPKATIPQLQDNEVAVFDRFSNVTYSLMDDKTSNVFDTLLLIDASGSMDTVDMPVVDIHDKMETFRKVFSTSYTTEFLEKLNGAKMISRIDGVLLSALCFIVERANQNMEDNLGVVMFSDTAKTVSYSDGKGFHKLHVNGRPEIGEAAIRKIKDNWHGLTNLKDGLVQAIEIVKNLDRTKMKKIIIISDGTPEKPDECMEFINSRIRPRTDIMINTIGFGPNVDEPFLARIANIAGGRFYRVNDLDELLHVCGYHARELKLRISEDTLKRHSFYQEIDGNYCVMCGFPLSYYGSHGWWYCDECQRYDRKEDIEKKCSCGESLSFMGESQRWFCYNCKQYHKE